jgi:hypothetical protein
LDEVRFRGTILRRGFWLYVWEVKTSDGSILYHVDRTGDSSSTKAQSPFNRMGQHLGFAPNSSMLRRHLRKQGVEPEACTFRLVALGPLEAEAVGTGRNEHDERRDVVAGMEKALAEALVSEGCQFMNRVMCRKPLDARRFEEVRAAFARAFPRLSAAVATRRSRERV